MSDPKAEALAEADAARAAIRSYEDAVLAQAEREEKLSGLGNRARADREASYAARFPALRARTTGGGR